MVASRGRKGYLMVTYYYQEIPAEGGTRRAVKTTASSLRGAKLIATRSQLFQRTTLRITDEEGAILSYRDWGDRRWSDVSVIY